MCDNRFLRQTLVGKGLTYESYTELLSSLICHGYQFPGYRNWKKAQKSVIIRHDVDMCLEKAVRMSG